MHRLRLGLVVLAFAGCAAAPERPARLLDRAIAAAGGEAALSRATTLAWRGSATVHAGGRDIAIAVGTIVEPFGYARSESWPQAQGPAGLRVLQIDGDQGTTTRNGERTPLPAPATQHERAQYALYGLMRLVSLRDPAVRLERLAPDAQGNVGLRVQHPALPVTDLYFDRDAHLRWLRNAVPKPDGAGTQEQRIDFGGEIVDAGVRWPRTLAIRMDGQPYFDLDLREFHACTTRAACAAALAQ